MKPAAISVVGSYSDEPKDQFSFFGTAAEFQGACRSIGQLLAKLGHTLVVQYDDPRTADQYCVEGYLNQIEQNPKQGDSHLVVVGRPASSTTRHFDRFRATHPTIFDFRRFSSQRWDSARFESCLDSDATIVIGGAGRAEKTGYVVLSSGGLLLPIGSFGGAAELLLVEVENRLLSHRKLPPPLTIEHLRKPWSGTVLAALEEALSMPYRRPRIVIVHGRDDGALNELTQVLRAVPNPPDVQVMKSVDAFGMTLSETWEQLAESSDGAVALATPDDEGRLRNPSGPSTDPLTPRARQNIWLEYGWFWGRLRRAQVLLLVQRDAGGASPDVPSDALGIRYAEWKVSPNERTSDIVNFIDSVRSNVRPFT